MMVAVIWLFCGLLVGCWLGGIGWAWWWVLVVVYLWLGWDSGSFCDFGPAIEVLRGFC